jgi:hypothetical protein
MRRGLGGAAAVALIALASAAAWADGDGAGDGGAPVDGGASVDGGELVDGGAPADPPTGAIEGEVRARADGRPLGGVRVRVGGREVVTDGGGRFVLDGIPAGALRLEVIVPGDPQPLTVDEEIAPGARRAVRYTVSLPEPAQGRGGFQTTVRGRVRREAGAITVDATEARRTAGAAGDAVRAVQSLPGVARPAFGGGLLVVWGAAPRETRLLVDGVEVPALFHVGGLRSTLPSSFVERVELTPAAWGAAYGRGLGGLVRVTTASPTRPGLHGEVALDVLDASAQLAYANRRVRAVVGGRYGWLDKLAAAIAPSAGDAIPLPGYGDYQAKVEFALRPGEELALVLLGSEDRLRRAIPASDPAAVREETQASSSQRLYARYRRALGGGARVEAVPSFSHDAQSLTQRFGLVPVEAESEAFRYGLRAQIAHRWVRPRGAVELAVGIDLLGSYTRLRRRGAPTIPPREGDLFVFGRPPIGEVALDRWNTHVADAALFAEAQATLGPVRLIPGLRLDVVTIDASRQVPRVGTTPAVGLSRLYATLEPRLLVRARLHPRVELVAAGGLYHQPPDPEDLSAVFGNPTLSMARAAHATAGLAVRVTDTLSVEATGFYKYFDGLAARSAQPTPALARALLDEGSGQAYGGQLVARQELWRGLSGWVSYTVGRSERRDGPGRATRPFDYDQTHILAVVASYAVRGFTFGARLRWATGMPRTPVVGAFYDARADAYQPRFGAQGALRLPDFVQLDLHADWRRAWRRAALELLLDVQNVTNQANAEEYVYNFDFTQRGLLTGLPTLVVAGARVEF